MPESGRSADDVQHNLEQAVEDARIEHLRQDAHLERSLEAAEIDRASRAGDLADEAAAALADVAILRREFKDLNTILTGMNHEIVTGKWYRRVLAVVCAGLIAVGVLQYQQSSANHQANINQCMNGNSVRAEERNAFQIAAGSLEGANPSAATKAKAQLFLNKIDGALQPRNCSAIK
jgi:hypothetical protein